MAEEKVETREVTWRQLLPWTELFRGFQIALDPGKLILAAVGIFVMSLCWVILAWIFGAGYANSPPTWKGNYVQGDQPKDLSAGWARFRQDRDNWNLMHETAGVGSGEQYVEPADLAQSPKELDDVNAVFEPVTKEPLGSEARKATLNAAMDRLVQEKKLEPDRARTFRLGLDRPKPSGRLASWPWFEDRGPNPYLLVTNQVTRPWEAGHFWEWFAGSQLPVMVEPLIKLFRPIVYFFSPRAEGFVIHLYFLLVLVFTVLTWSIFGGAITRIAAVQIARGEKMGPSEALRYTLKRLFSYLTAPLCPIVFVFFLLVLSIFFGLFHMIPIFGDVVVDGFFWWIPVIFGLLMALALIGLVGWPLMSATVSAEGTDFLEAVSRSYTYVFSRPWQYLWYALVAIAYGAVLVFFVGFMGSFAVYLSKWAVSKGTIERRDPVFLFAYAPTTFEWRELLLKGATVDGKQVVTQDGIDPDAYRKFVGRDENYQGADQMTWWNKVGAFMVAFWLFLILLLILGFGYSYFWGAGTIIYLLMRRSVDSAEFEEVFMEEEDQDGLYAGGAAFTAGAPEPAKAGQPLQMVEAPALRPSTAPVAPSAAVPEKPAVSEPAPALPPPGEPTGGNNNPPV
jgi:ABC-type multidrug transport system fused ATPase/permease subunit